MSVNNDFTLPQMDHTPLQFSPFEFELLWVYTSYCMFVYYILNRFFIPVRLPANRLVSYRNKRLATIYHWPKTWRVSLKIKPQGDRIPNLSNILHFTTGGNCCSNGQRIPALWFQPGTFSLRVASSINGNGDRSYDMTGELPMNKFTHVVIEQVGRVGGPHYFRFIVNGAELWFLENSQPMEFNNVVVYTSNPATPNANAIINDFKYEKLNGQGKPYNVLLTGGSREGMQNFWRRATSHWKVVKLRKLNNLAIF